MKRILKVIVLLFITLALLALSGYRLRIKEQEEAKSTNKFEEIVQIQIIDKYNNIEKIHTNYADEKYELVDVIIDGVYYYNVGIRTKGSVIYTYLEHNNSDRHSYKLKLDYMNENQNYKRNFRISFKYKCI